MEGRFSDAVPAISETQNDNRRSSTAQGSPFFRQYLSVCVFWIGKPGPSCGRALSDRVSENEYRLQEPVFWTRARANVIVSRATRCQQTGWSGGHLALFFSKASRLSRISR